MSNPITFPSITPHFSLPLLFAGQAQKEPTINHALSLIDALLRGTVDDSLGSPPNSPEEGSIYRILPGAIDEWEGRDDKLAIWIGGAWEFVEPSNGTRKFDQVAGVLVRYNDGWESAIAPAEPSGGDTIDSEARAAISEIVDALQTAGILDISPY